jgi:hypothetical protein
MPRGMKERRIPDKTYMQELWYLFKDMKGV